MDNVWLGHALKLHIESLNDILVAYHRHNDIKVLTNIAKHVPVEK